VSFLIAAPELIADAATDLANLAGVIGSANSAAAVATTGLLPAAADEVSAEIAALFSSHAAGYQQLSAQAAIFHQQFVQTLTAGAGSYAAGEVNVVQTLASAVPALGIDLSGGISGLAASLSADLNAIGVSLNAAVSASLGANVLGLAPLGAAIATNVNSGLTALAQTGGAIATNIGTGLSGLAGGFNAALPGLQASLTGGLAGLNGSLNAALSGALGADLAGFGPLVSTFATDFGNELAGFIQAGNTLAANLGAGLAGGLSLALPGLAASLSGGLGGLSASINAALSGGLGGSLSGLGPLGATLAADISSGLSGLAQTGGALVTSLTAGFPGLQASLTGGLAGLNGAINAALSGGFGGSLSGLGAALSGALQTGGSLIANLSAGLPALSGGLTLPANLTAALNMLGGSLGLSPSLGLNIMAGLNGLSAQLNAALNGGISLGIAGLPTLFANLVAPWQVLLTAPNVPAFLTQLQAMEVGFNTALITNELGLNTALVAQETALETALFGGTGAVGGMIDSFFNFWNTVLGTGEVTFDSILGAQLPTGGAILASLAVGAPANLIAGGALGGFLGALDTKFLWDLNLVSGIATALTGNGSLQAALTAGINAAGLQASLNAMLSGSLLTGVPNWGVALVAAPTAGLQGLASGQLNFLANLIPAEVGFNTNLVSNEMAWETATFGTNTAFNGGLNRLFNIPNLILGTGEQTLNSFLGGVQTPAIATVLTGTGAQVFNGGNIGGIEGIFDQTLAAGADFAGLFVA
jgi:hypothetical protein